MVAKIFRVPIGGYFVWGKIGRVWASIHFPFGAIVSWLATVIGIISGAASVAVGLSTTQTTKEVIWGWSLTAIAAVSFIAFSMQHLKRFKARAIASTLGQQAHASDILRETRNYLRMHAVKMRDGEDVSEEMLLRSRARIEEALTTYASVFSATTGTRCRLAIKLIRIKPREGMVNLTEEDFFVYTLARDSHSASENRIHDKKRADEYLDPLSSNSDFLSLWSPKEADEVVFIFDNLIKSEDYMKSSLNYRQNIQDNPNKPKKMTGLYGTFQL